MCIFNYSAFKKLGSSVFSTQNFFVLSYLKTSVRDFVTIVSFSVKLGMITKTS